MQPLKEIGFLVLLSGFYFSAVYFAVSALAPAYALQFGLIAAMTAMIFYAFLAAVRRDEGLVFGLLILLPISCITAGVAWWILRLLGFWFIK